MLTSAETGRRHRHSRSASVLEGTRSVRHLHDTVLLAARRGHVDRGCRTGRRSRGSRDGYAVGDAVRIAPDDDDDGIRGRGAVAGTVITAVARLVADDCVCAGIAARRVAVTPARGAAAHSGDTHHPLPRDILDRTGRSGTHPGGLKDRVLLRRIGTGDGRQTTGGALARRHRIRRHHLVGCRHVMTVILLRGFEL